MDIQWPPQGEDAQLLDQLGQLIERAGAAHFLDGPVVRSDTTDFPEAWAPTRACVERLLNRLFWLAHVDLEVATEDLRSAHYDPNKLLRRSVIEWIETKEGVAHFQIEAIGNDNVAGLLTHEVGRAFTAWVTAAAPYREAEPEPPTPRDGTIAAVYLGLGVVATNASQYHRLAGEVRGRDAVTEWEVVVTGGLSPRQLLILLAVQAVLRGKLEVAHHSLRADLLENLQLLVTRLTPHRKELATYLGLELEAPRPALEREPAPVTVSDAERPEPDRRQRFAGSYTTRHRLTFKLAGGLLGLGAGIAAMLVFLLIFQLAHLKPGPVYGAVVGGLMLASIIGGVIAGAFRVRVVCSGYGCYTPAPPDLKKCPGCGATLVSREELQRLIEADDAKYEEALAEEAEAAGRS